MPAVDHLAKLTYLFEIAADDDAPKGLQTAVLDYLHSDDGLAHVNHALMPLAHGQDAKFEALANRARPIAQANRVHAILAAFAEEMPPSATLKQALTFARVAQGHYLDQTGQGKLHISKSLAADPDLPKNLNHTLHGALAGLFAVDSYETRETPVRLSADGVALIRRILHRMRVEHESGDGLSPADTVETITDRFRN